MGQTSSFIWHRVSLGEAEATFSAAFSTSASFIELALATNSTQPLKNDRALYAREYSIWLCTYSRVHERLFRFSMSKAQPERKQEFLLRVLGAQVCNYNNLHACCNLNQLRCGGRTARIVQRLSQ